MSLRAYTQRSEPVSIKNCRLLCLSVTKRLPFVVERPCAAGEVYCAHHVGVINVGVLLPTAETSIFMLQKICMRRQFLDSKRQTFCSRLFPHPSFFLGFFVCLFFLCMLHLFNVITFHHYSLCYYAAKSLYIPSLFLLLLFAW
jgi:hypothetical protein